MLNSAPGLLSRPCARMETRMGNLFLGIIAALCVALVLAMFCFGPQILEWLEDMPPEPG